MLVSKKANIEKKTACITVLCSAQRYDQFLHVGQLYRALILLDLALYLSNTSVYSVFMVLCIFNFCCILYLLVSSAWWDWPLTWLTNHRPSSFSAVTLLVGSCDP